MATPANELGITGYFRINKGSFDREHKWLPFTNLKIDIDAIQEMIITFKESVSNKQIASNIENIKNIKYNKEIEAKRSTLARLTPKPNRIDIEGIWLNSYSNWSFSIDTLDNYNKVVDKIADIKTTIEKDITDKKNKQQELVQVAIKEEKLKPGATYNDLLNYYSLQEYIEAGKLKPDATVADYVKLKEDEDEKNIQQKFDHRFIGGRKREK